MPDDYGFQHRGFYSRARRVADRNAEADAEMERRAKLAERLLAAESQQRVKSLQDLELFKAKMGDLELATQDDRLADTLSRTEMMDRPMALERAADMRNFKSLAEGMGAQNMLMQQTGASPFAQELGETGAQRGIAQNTFLTENPLYNVPAVAAAQERNRPDAATMAMMERFGLGGATPPMSLEPPPEPTTLGKIGAFGDEIAAGFGARNRQLEEGRKEDERNIMKETLGGKIGNMFGRAWDAVTGTGKPAPVLNAKDLKPVEVRNNITNNVQPQLKSLQ